MTTTSGTFVLDDHAESKFKLKDATSAQVTLGLSDPAVSATFYVGCDPITQLEFTSDTTHMHEMTVDISHGEEAVTISMPDITIGPALSACPLYFRDETNDPWKNFATFDQNTRIVTIPANSWTAGVD